MRTTILRISICLACLPFFSVSAQGDDAIIYKDDFADVDGFTTSNWEGNYEDSSEQRTREAHSYMSNSNGDGGLEITVKEDDERQGPDGKPGVLVWSFDSVPKSAEYSGFHYSGRVGEPIIAPEDTSDLEAKDLAAVRLKFRYKASNKDKSHAGMSVNFRFEPETDDAYERRIDFGSLKATDKWQLFDKTLDKGANLAKFVESVKALQKPKFKLVWGQEGEVSNYQDGDTLLIDDIELTYQK